MQRSVTFLDCSGDVTLVWDETTDEKMLKIIEDRIAKGWVFYVLKPRTIPMLPPKKVKARTIDEVKEAGSVIIMDKDVNLLFSNGDIRTATPANDLDVVKRSTDSREIVRSQTAAVKPARGG